MYKQRFLRASLVAVFGVLAALIVPSAAQATAQVSAAKSDATCVELRAVFEKCELRYGVITWTIRIDDTPYANGQLGPLDTDADSRAGDKYTFVVPLTDPAGVHVVRFDATWPTKDEDDNGTLTKTVGPCAGPPPPPPPVYDCQCNVLPPGTTLPTCPPPTATMPPPTTPPAGPPQGGGPPGTAGSGGARPGGP